VRGQVDGEPLVRDRPLVGLVGQPAAAGATEHRTDPHRQLARAERLGHVVVGADLEPRQPLVLLAQRGQHHHRDGPPLAQPPADLEAVDAGQHQVEHHQVGGALGDHAQCLVAVADALHAVAVAHQVALDYVRHRRVVIDHDDPAGQVKLAAGHDAVRSGVPGGRFRVSLTVTP
jgi:hypothetical protein